MSVVQESCYGSAHTSSQVLRMKYIVGTSCKLLGKVHRSWTYNMQPKHGHF
jgi:hypothetical protein